jgi:hypothetical protein
VGAARVYTTRFLYAETKTTVTFVVPEGFRAVIRSLTVCNLYAGATAVNVKVHGVYVAMLPIPAQYDSRNVSLSCVAFERETVQLELVQPNTHAMLCGYLFTDTDGDPPWVPPATSKPIEPSPPRPGQLPHR